MESNSSENDASSYAPKNVNNMIVSVIMITYNHEEFISDAIASVLEQQCDFDYELIIADDFSYDHTGCVIQQILNENPEASKIRHIKRENNIGRTGNFLDALKQSNGKYIAICDGDDYWINNSKLQKQVDFLEKNPDYTMVCHDAFVINQVRQFSKLFYNPSFQQRVFSTKQTLKSRHFCPTASIVFRRESFMRFINTEFIPFAGDHTLVHLLSLTGLIYRMSDVMSVYRLNPKGVSQVAKPFMEEVLINRIDALKYFNKVSHHKFWKNVRIEILLLRNRIAMRKTKSKYKLKYLTFYNRILTKMSNYV